MSYSTLMDYNSYAAGSCQQPMRAPISAMAVQVVPVYSPPGYEALTHGPCAGDHLNITQAYPSNCDKFVQRLCDCNCGQPQMPMPMPMPSPSGANSMAFDPMAERYSASAKQPMYRQRR